MEIELLTTLADFLCIETAWHELSERCPGSNLFTSFEWMLTWWACLGTDKRLMIFVLRSSNKIIGIAPLMKVRKSFMKYPYDEVYLLSATDNPYSPRAFAGTLDFLIPDEFTREYEQFIRYLLTSFKKWNYLKLHPLPENSPTLAIFRKIDAELHRGITIAKVFENACIRVPETWEEYEASRSSKFRKNIRQCYRKLMENHHAEFIEYRRPEEMEQAISYMLAIEQKSWKSKDGVKINDPRMKDFYFSLARKFSEKNMTRLWVLKIDGIPAAYDLNIQNGNCIKALKSSYDEDFATLSPGILLNYIMYERFLQEGIRHIDLLFGNLQYKQRWTNVLEPHYGVYLKRSDPYTGIIDACMKSPAMQKLQQKYRGIARYLGKRPGCLNASAVQDSQIGTNGNPLLDRPSL